MTKASSEKQSICISIGIPVYKGEKYIKQTLRSIQSQNYKNFDVLVSVDGNDQNSAKICAQFLSDPRFKLFIQKTQIGWIKNVSYLMQNQTGDYWCYHAQDDLMTKSYLKKLLAYAKSHPKAAVVYSDIQCFGTLRKKMIQPPVKGKPFDREINLIRHYLPAIAIRGLTRQDVIKASGGMRDNALDGFCSDTTWMATVARFGELHRVSEPLYKKRFHSKNTHKSWEKHTSSWLENAWATHCKDMLLEAWQVADTPKKRYKIFKSILYRLLKSRVSRVYINTAEWTRFKRIQYILKFILLIMFPI